LKLNLFVSGLAHALGLRYYLTVRVLVELRKPEAATWDHVGVFAAAPEELAALRSVLSRHENPIDALPLLPRGLLWDTIDVIRAEGWLARVRFVED
jgi:hypothetical protein